MNQEVRINLPFFIGFDLVGPLWAYLVISLMVGITIGKYLL